MLKKSRATGGHGVSAHKAKRGVPPARGTNSRAEGQAVRADKATRQMPDAREPNAAGIEGHIRSADEANCMVPPSPQRFSDDPRIRDLIAEARNRTYWMQMRLRNAARLVAEIRSLLQPGRGQEEEWNEDTKSEALEIVSDAVALVLHARKQAERDALGKKLRERKVGMVHPLLRHPIVFGTALSLADYEAREDEALHRMEKIVATLDISGWLGPHCKGFTHAGLAVLIGHAGDFRDYPKKGHLWKRLGLAPYEKDGVTRAGSSWGRHGGLSKDDWIVLGYKRSRLGDIFGKITQPLFRAQWQTPGKDDAGEKLPAVAIGPYGEAFGAYKARQRELNEAGAFAVEAEQQWAAAKKNGRKPQKALLEGKLPDSQINSRALRYMTKRLIADLRSAWRRLGHKRSADKASSAVSTVAEPIEREACDPVPQPEASRALPTAQSQFGEDVANVPLHESAVMRVPASPNPIQPKARHRLPQHAASAQVPTAEPQSALKSGQTARADKAKAVMPSSADPNADARASGTMPSRASRGVPKRRRVIAEAAE